MHYKIMTTRQCDMELDQPAADGGRGEFRFENFRAMLRMMNDDADDTHRAYNPTEESKNWIEESSLHWSVCVCVCVSQH